MDETTHQLSRKVIDRAMTIEMNLPKGNPFKDFFKCISDLTYLSNPVPASKYLPSEVKASDIIELLARDYPEETEWLKDEIASFLLKINDILERTPFKVAYRVQNELVLYFYQTWLDDKDGSWQKILHSSCDHILMMKVLPRIEGDEELLEEPLDRLIAFTEAHYPNAYEKLKEMRHRLSSRFTSFWP